MSALKIINSDVDSLISHIDSLPSLPTIVYELSQALGDPSSTLSQIEAILINDPSISARVLKVANSAYYAIPGGVSHIQNAIGVLGFDAIQQIVISTSVMDVFKDQKNPDASKAALSLWKHSLGTAMTCEKLAVVCGWRNTSGLFAAGLLHDLGKIIWLHFNPDDYALVLKTAHDLAMSFTAAELHLQKLSHTQMGYLLAKKWLFPHELQMSILYHHEKDLNLRKNTRKESQHVVDLVLAANLLIKAFHFGEAKLGKVEGIPKTVFDRLNLTQLKLAKASALVQQNLDHVADLLIRLFQDPSEDQP